MTEPFVSIRQWAGINNQATTPTELTLGELVTGNNADIDDKAKSISRRQGFAPKLAGTFRDLDPAGSGLIIRNDTELHALQRDVNGTYTTAMLKSGLTAGARMSYADVNDGLQTWCTNNHEIGFVTDDMVWHDLPEVDSGEPISSVAESLRLTRSKMPAGKLIEHYHGRMFVATDEAIFISDAMAFHRCHNENGFFATAGRPTLLKSVEDGIWYADGKIWFAAGGDIMDSDRKPKAEYNAIFGQAIRVPGEKLGIRELSGVAFCIVFWTEQGICVGGPGGLFINLTQQRYHLSGEFNQAMPVFRPRSGINQVITLLN